MAITDSSRRARSRDGSASRTRWPSIATRP